MADILSGSVGSGIGTKTGYTSIPLSLGSLLERFLKVNKY